MLISQPVRQCIQASGGIVLIVCPLGSERLSPVALLGIGTGVTWTILVTQVVGVLPTSLAAVRHRAFEAGVIDTTLDRGIGSTSDHP